MSDEFILLQEGGLYLALNRSLYFNFRYFMFFYNVFLGLVSCLLHILKAMFVSIVFYSHLDNSYLPCCFEFTAPGIKAYICFMHVEAADTHPVMIIFTCLMLLAFRTSWTDNCAPGWTDNCGPGGKQGTGWRPADGDHEEKEEHCA